MRVVILAAALSLASTGAFASCKADAASKKLAGAALASFMKKCEADANAKCEADFELAQARRRGKKQPHEEVRHRRGRRLTRVGAGRPVRGAARFAPVRSTFPVHSTLKSDGFQSVSG